jgi:hypothetical protein
MGDLQGGRGGTLNDMQRKALETGVSLHKGPTGEPGQWLNRARPGIDMSPPTAKICSQKLLYFWSPVSIMRCVEKFSSDKTLKDS